MKKIGKQTVKLVSKPVISEYASAVGLREGECGKRFFYDIVERDPYFGMKSWEAAESEMLGRCFDELCRKAGYITKLPDYILSGDLLNQCVSSAFTFRNYNVPYFGLYGACSTMAESMSLGAMLVDAGFAETVCAITGSHFCTAERQYRFPLEYGGAKTPTAQCTVTGSGAVLISSKGEGAQISHVTTGKIVDAGISDANNMGSAMAPAALDTLSAHFKDTGRQPEYYDAIFTGDLGAVGHDILQSLAREEKLELKENYFDCGVLIYSDSGEKKRRFGSGCGCCASVLCGYILPEMKKGRWNRVLFAATGALLSTVTVQQKESIPGICHAIAIENEV